MSINIRWLFMGLVAMNFGFFAGSVPAQQLPEGVNKPGSVEIDPVKKVMCQHNNKLYEQKSILEINGKDYYCTRYHSWVLYPVQDPA